MEKIDGSRGKLISFFAEIFYLNPSTTTHLETNDHNTNNQAPITYDASQTQSLIHTNELNAYSSTDPDPGKSKEHKMENTELKAEGKQHFPEGEPQTTKEQTETINMEIHKHPHHVTHKKKWNEYLLEFFMIFFAVTLGFYAENIRENYSDSGREKEYMRSMIEDLEQDTANCDTVINKNAAIIHGLDTLISQISNTLHDKNNINLIYAYCIKYRYYNPEVQFSERTMSQLKNNGGLRLVKIRDVSDGLSAYDQGIRSCDRQRDQALHYYGTLDESEVNIFDFAPIKPLWDSLSNVDVLALPINSIVHSIAGKVYLKNTDGNQLTRYMNQIIYDQVAIASYNDDLAKQNNKAISLIRLIEKKYGLKDE